MDVIHVNVVNFTIFHMAFKFFSKFQGLESLVQQLQQEIDFVYKLLLHKATQHQIDPLKGAGVKIFEKAAILSWKRISKTKVLKGSFFWTSIS